MEIILLSDDIEKDYAEIFNGTVHRHSEFPTLLQRIKKYWRIQWMLTQK